MEHTVLWKELTSMHVRHTLDCVNKENKQLGCSSTAWFSSDFFALFFKLEMLFEFGHFGHILGAREKKES